MRPKVGYLGGFIIGILVLGFGSVQAETLQDAVQYMLQTNPEIDSTGVGLTLVKKSLSITTAGVGSNMQHPAGYGL